jgi:hypothetical protein
MDLLTHDDVQALLAPRAGPYVSIYQPARRGGDEAGPIRWKNHLDAAEERLIAQGTRAPEARKFLEPARRLQEEPGFWKHQGDGLACFLADGLARPYRLPRTFADRVVVGTRFHITPLLPLLAGAGRFFVLALSQNGVRLLQGTRDAVHAIDVRGMPNNLAEALATHDTDEPLTFHGRPTSGTGWGAIYHGHGVGIDDAKDDLLRYFRRVDQALHAVLRDEKAPLLVAAVGYLQPIYRAANTYPQLLSEAIDGNPDRLSSRHLHDRGWEIVGPHFDEKPKLALALYRQLAGTGRTSDDLAGIVPAACRGEVETLFVAPDREVWGRVEPALDLAEVHDPPRPGDEDLLNVAAVQTLAHGRRVFAVDAGELPDGASATAIYCLPLAKHGKAR